MPKIFKFPLRIEDEQTITMPAPIKVLSVQKQGSDLQLWVLVSEEAPCERLLVRVVGTGHSFDDWHQWQYLNTVQDDLNFVWHVFYKDPNIAKPHQAFRV